MDLSRNKINKITPFGVKFPEIDLKERLVCLDEKLSVLFVMGLTKARFSEKAKWKVKIARNKLRCVVTFTKIMLFPTSSKRKCHCFTPLLFG